MRLWKRIAGYALATAIVWGAGALPAHASSTLLARPGTALAARLPENVTFSLAQTSAGTLEGIPEGAAPTGPITVRDAKFAGGVAGALVGTMSLTVTVTMQGPGYTNGTYTSEWTITANGGQGVLMGTATGAVATTLSGWPPTEVAWNAAQINVTARPGTGIFADTSGTGVYSDTGKYAVPAIKIPGGVPGTPPSGGQLPIPPTGQPPVGGPPALPRTNAALLQEGVGIAEGAMDLDLTGWTVPLLVAPDMDASVGDSVALEWRLPPEATFVQVQITGTSADLPALDVVLPRTQVLPAPPLGVGAFTWRARATNAVDPSDPEEAWGPWSDARAFVVAAQ